MAGWKNWSINSIRSSVPRLRLPRAGTATRGASTWTCHDGRSPAGFSAARPQSQSAPPEPGGSRLAAAPQAAVPQNRSAEQAEFDTGVQLLQQKKYEAARKEFQGFVSKFPKSDLDESALYNIGECYFSEKRYEDAIKAYQQGIDKYPKGGKTASALLKQGMGWQQMGEATMARIIYTRLVEKYPGTAQAQAADKKLKQM